jgi:predicted transcriptional regulator
MSQHFDNSLITDEDRESDSRQKVFLYNDMITNKTDVQVVEALLKIQPATRMDLCEKTGIPRTTIYDALTRLMLKRVVSKYSTPSKGKGRPKVYYRIV